MALLESTEALTHWKKMKATDLVPFCCNQQRRKRHPAFRASARSVPGWGAEEVRGAPATRCQDDACCRFLPARPRLWQHADSIKNAASGLQNLHNLFFLFFFCVHTYNCRHYTICLIERALKMVSLAERVFWLALRRYRGLKEGEREESRATCYICWLSLVVRNAALGESLSRGGQGVTASCFLTHCAFLPSVFSSQTWAETLYEVKELATYLLETCF